MLAHNDQDLHPSMLAEQLVPFLHAQLISLGVGLAEAEAKRALRCPEMPHFAIRGR